MSVQADEATVRQFLEIVNEHAKAVVNGTNPPGYLQLCRINPLDEKSVVPSRFEIGDIERMVKTAMDDAAAGHNVYVEARTRAPGLNGRKRGLLEDTAWAFGLVADCDADKNKSGNITVRPTFAGETSPGNYHLWYLFTRAIPAAQAKTIGDFIRAQSGADQDTGVVTQCYRVAGTPNFPNASKQARGRVTVEPTKIYQHNGRLWDPDELVHAFSEPVIPELPGMPSPGAQPAPQILEEQTTEEQEVTLPTDLLERICNGSAPGTRSDAFHAVVRELWLRNWTLEAIVALLEKYPNGIAEKYAGRVTVEAKRSYDKFVAEAAVSPQPQPQAGSPPSSPPPPPPSAHGPSPQPQPQPRPQARAYIKPTIDLRIGERPAIVRQAEQLSARQACQSTRAPSA
jgi:RepB DNA-primase from phage plasmid